VLTENVGQSSPNFFKGCYPLRPPIIPNVIEIGQTSLEKSVTEIGPWTQKNLFCNGQKRDYLSRVSQRARGATKKEVHEHNCSAGGKGTNQGHKQATCTGKT